PATGFEAFSRMNGHRFHRIAHSTGERSHTRDTRAEEYRKTHKIALPWVPLRGSPDNSYTFTLKHDRRGPKVFEDKHLGLKGLATQRGDHHRILCGNIHPHPLIVQP